MKGCVQHYEAVKSKIQGMVFDDIIFTSYIIIYPITGSHFRRVCLNSRNVTAVHVHMGMLLLRRVLIRAFPPTVRHPSHFVAKKLHFVNLDDDRNASCRQNLNLTSRNYKIIYLLF